MMQFQPSGHPHSQPYRLIGDLAQFWLQAERGVKQAHFCAESEDQVFGMLYMCLSPIKRIRAIQSVKY